MMCKLASDSAACLAHRRESFFQHDPKRKPWARNPCETCPDGVRHETAHHKPEPDDAKPVKHPRRRLSKYTRYGPPCPICHKARPAQRNVKADRPCMDCWRKSPEYAEERRQHQRDYHRRKREVQSA